MKHLSRKREKKIFMTMFVHFQDYLLGITDYGKIAEIIDSLTCRECVDFRLKQCSGRGLRGFEDIYQCMSQKSIEFIFGLGSEMEVPYFAGDEKDN